MSVNFWLQALVRFVAGMSTLEEMAARAQKRSASTQMAFETVFTNPIEPVNIERGAEAEVFNIPLGGSSRDVRPRTTVMDEEEIHRRLMGEQPQVDTSQAENSCRDLGQQIPKAVACRAVVSSRRSPKAVAKTMVACATRRFGDKKMVELGTVEEIRMSRGGLPEPKRSEKI